MSFEVSSVSTDALAPTNSQLLGYVIDIFGMARWVGYRVDFDVVRRRETFEF